MEREEGKEEVNNKGKWCYYQRILCQEGCCKECEIYLTRDRERYLKRYIEG